MKELVGLIYKVIDFNILMMFGDREWDIDVFVNLFCSILWYLDNIYFRCKMY